MYRIIFVGPDSSVGLATSYGLECLGIESRWGEIFRTYPDRPWGLPSLLYNGYRVFPGCKAAGARRWPITPTSAEVACSKLKFTFIFTILSFDNGLTREISPICTRTFFIITHTNTQEISKTICFRLQVKTMSAFETWVFVCCESGKRPGILAMFRWFYILTM
jgi:hypothetical protein